MAIAEVKRRPVNFLADEHLKITNKRDVISQGNLIGYSPGLLNNILLDDLGGTLSNQLKQPWKRKAEKRTSISQILQALGK